MSKHHSHSGHRERAEDQPAETGGEVPKAASGTECAAGDTADPCAAGQGDAPETGQGDGPVPQADVSPEDRIALLETELADVKDQLLRKAADFENFRKRMNREKQDAIEYANQNLLLDLIPVIDDFDRALKSAEISKDFTGFYEGIDMIEKRLSSQLETKWGLKRFASEGEIFDPNRHEAIMMETSADVEEPVVKEDLLRGYTLKDRIIRSAKVKVLMPANPEDGNGAEDEGQDENGCGNGEDR
jgi:molecular chaperone GrpE